LGVSGVAERPDCFRDGDGPDSVRSSFPAGSEDTNFVAFHDHVHSGVRVRSLDPVVLDKAFVAPLRNTGDTPARLARLMP
jgi:hypothetical protein